MAKVAGASLMGLNAWERHQRFMHDMMTHYGGKLPELPETVKTDYDTLKEQYRFIRTADDDAEGGWEVALARRYYAKLFKEYAIADLSRYKEGKIGVRWRTEKEVVSGKGQFMCGAKGCEERRGLASFEVPLVYMEAGAQKRALVKVRVCPKHALQLNHRKNKELLRADKRSAKKRRASAGERECGDAGPGEEGCADERKKGRHGSGDRNALQSSRQNRDEGRGRDERDGLRQSSERRGQPPVMETPPSPPERRREATDTDQREGSHRSSHGRGERRDQQNSPQGRREGRGASEQQGSRRSSHAGSWAEADSRRNTGHVSPGWGERREWRRSPQERREGRRGGEREGSHRSSHARSRVEADRGRNTGHVSPGREERRERQNSPQDRRERRGGSEGDGTRRSSHAPSRVEADRGRGGSRRASLGKGEGREREDSPQRVTERAGSPLSPGRWGDDQGLFPGEFDDEDLTVAAEVDAFFEGMFL